MSNDVVKIYWTGGYDSSFRICQLSKLPVKIQPYYLAGERLSREKELEAIRNITTALKAKPDTRCTFLDLEIIPIEEWEKVEEVSVAYEELVKERRLGTQYEWLGWFAHKNPGIELSVQKGGRIDALLHHYNAIKEIDNPIIGKYYMVDKEKAPGFVNLIFGNYHFPLFGLTKVEMKEEYIRMNCGDIIDLTWFCHRPKKGEACGTCPPCRFVDTEGLGYRHSKKALRNMKKFRFYRKVRRSKLWRTLRRVRDFLFNKD